MPIGISAIVDPGDLIFAPAQGIVTGAPEPALGGSAQHDFCSALGAAAKHYERFSRLVGVGVKRRVGGEGAVYLPDAKVAIIRIVVKGGRGVGGASIEKGGSDA